MYTLSFWGAWTLVALLTWTLVVCASLGVNQVAEYIAGMLV